MSKWQPIKTAPRDGRYILLGNSGRDDGLQLDQGLAMAVAIVIAATCVFGWLLPSWYHTQSSQLRRPEQP